MSELVKWPAGMFRGKFALDSEWLFESHIAAWIRDPSVSVPEPFDIAKQMKAFAAAEEFRQGQYGDHHRDRENASR